MSTVRAKVLEAAKACPSLSCSKDSERNSALKAMASLLTEKAAELLDANSEDVKKAETKVASGGITKSALKRLRLDAEKIEEMRRELMSVASLPPATGKTLSSLELDRGLELFKVSVPLGVVCCIFESRPDALVQISALCIKSGNAVILKGGSEAAATNRFLAGLVKKSLEENGLPAGAVQLIESRQDVKELLGLDSLIDLIIARGSGSLVSYIKDNTRIPVLGHAAGICRVFVDSDADHEKAVNICIDAKTQYPAVCNAMETLLVHSAAAEKFLTLTGRKLTEKGVRLFADSPALEILSKAGIKAEEATEKSWATEYNDLALNVRFVRSLDEAISHINRFGSKHTDSIVTENRENALKFINMVDSSSVMWNASTRFSDGYRYGLGAEVGINTGKIHTRGPSGLDSLMTYKYILAGSGNVVSGYSGKGAKPFTHRKLDKKWGCGSNA
jgi:glutamate-5-semialdehyde dehydrogenase